MIHANRAVAALNIDTHRSDDSQQCQLDADDGQMPFAASSRLGGLFQQSLKQKATWELMEHFDAANT